MTISTRIDQIKHRLLSQSVDFRAFLSVIVAAAFSGALLDAVLNNYLDATFHISSLQRTILEIPRETPGLIVVFVSALLFFWCSRRLAVFAMLCCAAGLTAMALIPPVYGLLLGALFIYSMGQHIFMPLSSSIGMELAREGQTGRRLGQLNALRNGATIAGSFVVFLCFKFLHLSYSVVFFLAAAGFCSAAFFMLRMHKDPAHKDAPRLILHKEYSLYYGLVVLFGTRKQIFITFAPWVLVSVLKQPTQMIATLLTIGGIAGIIFQPILGKAIDRFGERVVLASEAAILIIVCLLYGFAQQLFPPTVALWVVCGCYISDQLLMSVGMARSTYLKKIALKPEHITPTLTMGISIDHVFSISTAVLCGLLWKAFGYQAVFCVGAGIAAINLVVTSQVRISKKQP